jgi:hypothetical protein
MIHVHMYKKRPYTPKLQVNITMLARILLFR